MKPDSQDRLVSVFMSELVDVFTDAIKSHQPLSLSIMTRMQHSTFSPHSLHLIFPLEDCRLIYPRSSPCEEGGMSKGCGAPGALEPLVLNISEKIY